MSDYQRRNYDQRKPYNKPDRPRPVVITQEQGIEVVTNLYKFKGREDLVLYQYLVTFSQEILRKNIFKKFMKMVEHNNFTEHFAFDGQNLLISNKKFLDTKLKIPQREGELECTIEYKNTVDSNSEPEMMIQSLETISRFYQKQLFHVEKKRMFNPSAQPFRLENSGLEVIPGLTSLFKLNSDGFYLNLDMCFGVFYKRIKIIDLIKELYDNMLTENQKLPNDFVSDLERILKNIQVSTIHREKNNSFKISGLLNKAAHQVEFEQEGKKTNIAEYFSKTYSKLEYPDLPLAVIKKKDNVIYLPLEVLEIKTMQKYMRKLNERQTASMIKIAALPPSKRFEMMKEAASQLKALENGNLKRFGVAFDSNLHTCKGTTLITPSIEFAENQNMEVAGGSFSLIGKKALEPCEIGSWNIFYFRGVISQREIDSFLDLAKRFNVTFKESPKLIQINSVTEFYKAEKANFNFVILPDKNAQRYEEIKRIAETYDFCYTQCLVSSNVVKLTNASFVSNLLLKINAKLGGKNWKLNISKQNLSNGLLSDKPTILLGIDVSHPGATDLESPSIVSVVGSTDYDFVKYKTIISHQNRREEICCNLTSYVKTILRAHFVSTKVKPQRIVIFRDGVGDSMLNSVFSVEIQCVKQACSELDDNYKPEINFIVCQKRHSVRFMSNENNVLPGTIISDLKHYEINKKSSENENTIKISPSESSIDFYMVSHHALQGTSRPVRYLVLLNESNFSAKDVHYFTYNLCHLYARATKSVSIVTPIYYAHLGAARGKCYLEKNDQGVVVMRSLSEVKASSNLFYL